MKKGDPPKCLPFLLSLSSFLAIYFPIASFPYSPYHLDAEISALIAISFHIFVQLSSCSAFAPPLLHRLPRPLPAYSDCALPTAAKKKEKLSETTHPPT
eukprot:748182-Hanusia_phi.AAC.1